ncbi:MAG: transposase, partial [Bacillota bacterium]
MKQLFKLIKGWSKILLHFIETLLMSNTSKNLEIIALRSQLAIYQEQVKNKKMKKPRANTTFRQLWVILSKVYPNWKEIQTLVTPATVKRWHKTAFKNFWRNKSVNVGRPRLSKKYIDLIKKISKENPNMSAEKISELLISLGYTDAPCGNTIRKYLPKLKNKPTKKQTQSWKTFLKNHSQDIWAMDFFVVPTLKFKILYVFIIINHHSRKIEHFGVTSNPNLRWVKQQIKNATPYDHKPKYLIHDNDSVFTCEAFKNFLSNLNIKPKRTAYRSPWQNGIAERVNGIIRQDLTNHIIPFNERHLSKLLQEYINDYYNTHRTHQGIDCKTPIPLPKYEPTTIYEGKLVATPVLNGLYHTYER